MTPHRACPACELATEPSLGQLGAFALGLAVGDWGGSRARMLEATCPAHLHDTIRALGSATIALHGEPRSTKDGAS